MNTIRDNRGVLISANTNLSGRWRISVLNKDNASVLRPFGDDFRDNLILDQGKHAIAGKSTLSLGNLSTKSSCLADLMTGMALIGKSATPPTPSHTGLLDPVTPTSYTSILTTPGYTCTTTSVSGGAGRTFTRSWDFDPVSSSLSLNEACIKSGGCYADFIFSRFVFPTTLNLESGQFVRLEYALTIVIDAIVNPIPVSISSGLFVGDGYIKLVGSYDNIFGILSSSGTVVDGTRSAAPGRGCLPIHVVLGATAGTYSGACMVVNGSDANASIVFPAQDTAPNIAIAPLSSRVTQVDKAYPQTYVDATFTKPCRYTFVAGNPYATTPIGGIIFSSQTVGYLNYGWLWAFNTPQSKEALKSISVVFNQTVL